jgi:hypothetical protein
VKAIMGKCVALQSTQKYAGQNSIFAEYCYNNDEYRDLLQPWFRQQMETFDTAGKRLKYAKQCMVAMSPEDDNCPFILSDLSFAQFSDYLERRTSRRGKNKGKDNSLGMSTIEQAKSALRNLFRFSNYEMSPSMEVLLKQFLSGKKRDIAEKKKMTGDYLRIGKAKMDFKVYEKLCDLFLKEEGEEFIFARCFLALEWNLMARSENIVHANILHISWDNDSLVFRFVKTKGDQTGRNKDQKWHVYATPDNPTTCPVLAMACYLFANPGILSSSTSVTDVDIDSDSVVGDGMEVEEDDMELEADELGEDDGTEAGLDIATSQGKRRSNMHSGRLFPGGNQYDRFMDCLHRIIDKHRDDFFSLGISAGDLGSHSARKGACSYASAGTTVSPPIVSICLRAMWSMGQVKERYLQYEKAGDQYLGRVVSGLDVNSVTFAVSPPFFDVDDETRVQIEALIKSYVVGGKLLPAGVYQIFHYCFASLCYHYEFLTATLHQKSKLQASPFFSAMPQYAKSAATTKFPWEKTSATPTFTGIPPHISLLAQVEQLKIEMAKNRDDILAGFKSDLDGRQIGSQNYFDKETVCALITEMHNDMTSRFDNFGKNAANIIRECSGVDDVVLQHTRGNTATESTVTMMDPNGGAHKFQVFFGKNGIISRVPSNFMFPEMTLCTLITFWFCGNPRMKIVPLKMISAREIANEKERPKLTKIKAMMQAVQLGATKLGVSMEYNGVWDIAASVRLFETVEPLFNYPAMNGKVRRCNQISWITVHNLYTKDFRKKFATEVDVD